LKKDLACAKLEFERCSKNLENKEFLNKAPAAEVEKIYILMRMSNPKRMPSTQSLTYRYGLHCLPSPRISSCWGFFLSLSINSTSISFTPHDIKPGTYMFDIGTAGSMTLVFQACLLSAFHTSAPLTITLRGGSDVRWAPSWDYFTSVFLQILSKIGIKTETQLIKRGYYPTGGGEATLTVHPIKTLIPFHAEEPQNFTEISGIRSGKIFEVFGIVLLT
jgi:hypothetical protein